MHQLSSYIRLFLGFTIMSIVAMIFIPIFLLFLPWRSVRINIGNAFGKIVTPMVLLVLGTKMVIRNPERLASPRPALYLSNHSSQLDPLIAISVCPFNGCGVAKKEIITVPFFGWAYLVSGHLLLDRGNTSKAVESLKELGRLVRKHNLGVWIWPEGTRSIDGNLLPFKKGFAHVALETKLPIIPIVVRNANKLWPSKSLVVHQGTFTVDLLAPVSTAHWTMENIDSHIKEIEAIYRDALEKEPTV